MSVWRALFWWKSYLHTSYPSLIWYSCVYLRSSDWLNQVSSLALTLSRPPHRIPTIFLSIDDFYLSHELQAQLAASNPDNPLIQHRGQPSTHDLTLALSLFASLRDGREIEIPSYDKSAFGGEGERTPQSEWKVVNGVSEERIRVIILEGWCVGFRALEDQELRNKWEKAEIQRKGGDYQGRLGWNRFEDVKFVNEALRGYDSLTKYGLIPNPARKAPV